MARVYVLSYLKYYYDAYLVPKVPPGSGISIFYKFSKYFKGDYGDSNTMAMATRPSGCLQSGSCNFFNFFQILQRLIQGVAICLCLGQGTATKMS